MGWIAYLQEEFEKRKQKNSQYSMRSYARDLDISAATLSHILRGKRKLTESMISSFSVKLKLNETEARELNQNEENRDIFRLIDPNEYQIPPEWYHDVIIELTHIKNFESSYEFVATKLGITLEQATEAVDYLLEQGRLKLSPNQKWTDPIYQEGVSINSDDIRLMQNIMFEKAAKANLQYSNKLKRTTTVTFSVNSKDIAEIKAMYEDFFKKVMEYAQRPGREHDQVYELIVSLFPHTNPEE